MACNLETFRVKCNDVTPWDVARAKPAVQVELDGCFVPSATAAAGLRADTANAVVIGQRPTLSGIFSANLTPAMLSTLLIEFAPRPGQQAAWLLLMATP